LEAALDDRAAASRLAWSKGPFDRLARGLLDSDPVAVAHAQEIISAADGIADEPSINLADSTEWEQPTKVGTKAVRHANGKSAPDAISGFEV
jgi:hypothetical protein